MQTLQKLENGVLLALREIEITEQLGIQGWCMQIGSGTAAALAKRTPEGKVGYFGTEYVRGTYHEMLQLVVDWNAKHGGSEFEASVPSKEQTARWFRRQAAILQQACDTLRTVEKRNQE